MSLLQLLQLLLVLHPILIHLSILQLLLQGFHFPLESLSLHILPLTLTLFLTSNGLFTNSNHLYIVSQSWFKSIPLPSVLVLLLGDNIPFLAVDGLTPEIFIIINNIIIIPKNYVSCCVCGNLCSRTNELHTACSSFPPRFL